MRFDDRIATVLAQPESDSSALLVKWRQLVDLLAQTPHAPGAQRDAALAFVRDRRSAIDRASQDRIVASLPPDLPGDLAAIFDVPLPVPEDASPDPAPDAESIAHESAGPLNPSVRAAHNQIRELLQRIEAFRAEQSDTPAEREAPVRSFRWETGADGVVIWVEGAPRGALIGQTIASMTAQGQFGVDGQAAGAFAKRMPFRDARFGVAGSAPASGEWRISGVPFFDPGTGAFLGYRGSGRRPRLDETALPPSSAKASGGLFGTDVQPDALRQLIHELRTPLNAILGFAELIEGQFLGPAADVYRDRARAIHQQAGRLLGAVEDLDTAARIATRRHSVEESRVDIVALVERLRDDYARAAAHRHASLELAAPVVLPLAGVDPANAERMCSRLLAATIGLAEEGEALRATIEVRRYGVRELLCLSITRPRAVEGQGESELLDPGYSPEGDWPQAPALGLGFALRLVRNLAEAAGGSLEIESRRFLLQLPAAQNAERRQEGV